MIRCGDQTKWKWLHSVSDISKCFCRLFIDAKYKVSGMDGDSSN